MAYFRFDRITVVTSSRSRACVHSPCSVYIADPSACIVTTRRPGAPTAAPVAIGIPPPIAPPVSCIQSCGAAPRVAGKKPRPKLTLSSTTIAFSGISAPSVCASASDVTAPRAGSCRTGAAPSACGSTPSASANRRSASGPSCSGRASTWTLQSSGYRRPGLPG